MPNTDSYEHLTASAFRELSRRLSVCAERLQRLAAAMDETGVDSVRAGIVDTRNKLERIESSVGSLVNKTEREINQLKADRVRDDIARVKKVRRNRQKNNG